MSWWSKLKNSLKKSKREFELFFGLTLYTLAILLFYNGYRECHIFGSNRMFMSLSIFSTLIVVLLASVFGREGR